MSRLESLIRYFSPAAARRRTAHRHAENVMLKARGYEAAQGGRLSSGWWARSGDADTVVKQSARPLRDRARDGVRNSPILAQAVSIHANNIVGTGIKPRAKTGNEDMDERINDLFDEWTERSHPEGTMTWYGQQYLACRTMAEAGEIFARVRTRRLSDGLPVPMQVQMLEPEYCDENRLQLVNGANIISGIQFDKIGRRAGYWMFKHHPHTSGAFTRGNESTLVKAEDVVHLYEPQRTQVRGVTWLAPVLNKVRDLEEYELAENIRKKIEACYVGIIIPEDNDDGPYVGRDETELSNDVSMTDMQGNPFERFEPGMFGIARGGKDVKFNNPALTQGLEAYIRTRLRAISSGCRMPYELLTGDFSQANYASGRMGILEYRRFVRSFQRHYFIPQFCAPTTRWFVQRAIWAEKLPEDIRIRWEYQVPAFEAINPVDDAKADLMDMRMGKRSPQDVIGSTGRDPVRVLDEFEEFFKMADQRNLVLDSNPAQVTINGQSQMTNTSSTPSE